MKIKTGYVVLSAFDGGSCGRVTLDELNIPVDTYLASEIDPYAITVASNNYLDTIQIGDITKVDGHMLPKIDLLIGGSPCQGFSFSGKQLNFDDPRSRLFFEFVRLLKECKPKFFFLENVVMKKIYYDVISDHLGVQPVFLNSNLVSAQSRPRMYWTNIPGYKPPEDKGVVLDDILEHDAPYDRMFTESELQDISANGLILMGRDHKLKGFDQSKRVYSSAGKSPTLHTCSSGNSKAKVTKLHPGAIRGRKLNKGVIVGRRLDENGTRKDYDKNVPITQCLEVRTKNADKSNCLTTVAKDNVLTELPPGRYPDAYKNNLPYRTLTVIEYERLQGLKDNYTIGVSNSQRFKICGNGWNVPSIKEFFKHLPPVEDLDLY